MLKILSLVSLFIAHASFANESSSLSIVCESPSGFAGNAANVEGLVNKTGELKDGNEVMRGELAIEIGGSGPKPVLRRTKTAVVGSRLVDGAMWLSADKKELAIYVNPTRSGVSNVEFAGKFYRMECKVN